MEKLKSIDIFGHQVNLKINRKDTQRTWGGFCLTLLLITVSMSFVVTRLQVLLFYKQTNTTLRPPEKLDPETTVLFDDSMQAYGLWSVKQGFMSREEYLPYGQWYYGNYYWYLDEETNMFMGGIDIAPMELCTDLQKAWMLR